eukprot:8822505-Alexandrium_andersonii.AAC.1
MGGRCCRRLTGAPLSVVVGARHVYTQRRNAKDHTTQRKHRYKSKCNTAPVNRTPHALITRVQRVR